MYDVPGVPGRLHSIVLPMRSDVSYAKDDSSGLFRHSAIPVMNSNKCKTRKSEYANKNSFGGLIVLSSSFLDTCSSVSHAHTVF